MTVEITRHINLVQRVNPDEEWLIKANADKVGELIRIKVVSFEKYFKVICSNKLWADFYQEKSSNSECLETFETYNSTLTDEFVLGVAKHLLSGANNFIGIDLDAEHKGGNAMSMRVYMDEDIVHNETDLYDDQRPNHARSWMLINKLK